MMHGHDFADPARTVHMQTLVISFDRSSGLMRMINHLGSPRIKKCLKWHQKRAGPLKSSGPIVARKTYFGVRIFTHRAGPKNGEIRKPELKTSAANLAESRNEQR